MTRTVLGLLAVACAAPLAVVTLFQVLEFQQSSWITGPVPVVVIDNTGTYAGLAVVVALFMTMAIGAPAAHQLAHGGRTRGWVHMVLGATLGALPFLAFDGYIMGTKLLLDVRPAPDLNDVLMTARWAGIGAWCGLWSAGAYWAVAIRSTVNPQP